MIYKIIDGKAKFPIKCFIVNNLKHEHEKYLSVKDGKIYCYSQTEIDQTTELLTQLEITYNTEDVVSNDLLTEKTKDVVYQNDVEFEEHITLGKEPQSQVIPNIHISTDIVGVQLVESELKNLQLQQENQMLGSMLVKLELEILNLKSKVGE